MRVVDFEKAAGLVVKLHELTRHFELSLGGGVLHGTLDLVHPSAEQVVLEVLDRTDDLPRSALKVHHAAQVSKETLGDLEVVLDLEHELAGPDNGTHRLGDITTLRRFLVPWNRVQTLTSAHVKFLAELTHFVDKQLKQGLTVLLHLSFDRFFGEKTLPSLEFSELLGG